VKQLKKILCVSLLLVFNQVFGQTSGISPEEILAHGIWHPIRYREARTTGDESELRYVCNNKNRQKLVDQTQSLGIQSPEQLWYVMTQVICGKGSINLKKLSSIIHLPFYYSGNQLIPGVPKRKSESGEFTEIYVKNFQLLTKLQIPFTTRSNVSIHVAKIKQGLIDIEVSSEDADIYQFKLINGKWYWAGYIYGPAD
jgi:hypothetical protein